MTAPETLELKSVGAHVLLVTLNRPEASNAFNTQMAWDLVELFERLSVSANGTRVVVLTGAGDKAFCAGGDLKERKGMTDEAWQAQHLVYERMIRAVITWPMMGRVLTSSSSESSTVCTVSMVCSICSCTEPSAPINGVAVSLMPTSRYST